VAGEPTFRERNKPGAVRCSLGDQVERFFYCSRKVILDQLSLGDCDFDNAGGHGVGCVNQDWIFLELVVVSSKD
jgi:hypothetical protein